jgi:hypothetical protein
MSEFTETQLKLLLNELKHFNLNDPLVNRSVNDIALGRFESLLTVEGTLKKILSDATKWQREQGINPLCVAFGQVEWNYKSRRVTSPLWLIPCLFNWKKKTNLVEIQLNEEEGFANPFLLNELLDNVEQGHNTPDSWIARLKNLFKDDDVHIEPNSIVLNNFHPYRFEPIRELNELLERGYSEQVKSLLGDSFVSSPFHVSQVTYCLFPCDKEQRLALESVACENTVVQGPPGTGKSQVIANAIGNTLNAGKSVIVVSEKRAALEVIQQKLGAKGLSNLSYLHSSNNSSKDFIHELKNTWNHLENMELTPTKTPLISPSLYAQLHGLLDKVNAPKLFSGISFSAFLNEQKPPNWEKAEYDSRSPDMELWLNIKKSLLLVCKTINPISLGRLNPRVLNMRELPVLDVKITALLNLLNKLGFALRVRTKRDIESLTKKALLCKEFSHHSFKHWECLIEPGNTQRVRFEKLVIKRKKLSEQLLMLEAEKKHWRLNPTLSEIQMLRKAMLQKGFWKQRRFKKSWLHYSHQPIEQAGPLLNQWEKQYLNRQKLIEIDDKLRQLRLADIENDIVYIQSLTTYLSEEKWLFWKNISEDERVVFAELHEQLQQTNETLKSYFSFADDDDLLDHLQLISKLLPQLIAHASHLENIPGNLFSMFHLYPSIEGLERVVLKTNYSRFISQFPALQHFSGEEIMQQIKRINHSLESESSQLCSDIWRNCKEQLNAWNKLLQTPGPQLSVEEKQHKTELRKGKAQLVREFSKSRNHLSIRELYSKECRHWIQLLKPIQLFNPVQVARIFPMEQGLFDLAIFDEATQVPLAHALGTVNRSRRIMVAGDEQQMSPSMYFKSGTSEQVNLLHQASFHWESVHLKHHYRSHHPDLIAFSNRHFYNDTLIAFPSAKGLDPCIHDHYLSDGIFHHGINEFEASAVADYIEKTWREGKSIGVVAFSESQLASIRSKISENIWLQLENTFDNGVGFFKALEQVQGDECDELIISFGYGRDHEGIFRMQFGPLNGANGTRRLNVLMSRARKHIHFFSSVRSSDFKLSTNQGVDLLRQMMHYIEQYRFFNQKELTLPFPLSFEVSKNKLMIPAIWRVINDAEELITFYSTMQSKGWEIELV